MVIIRWWAMHELIRKFNGDHGSWERWSVEPVPDSIMNNVFQGFNWTSWKKKGAKNAVFSSLTTLFTALTQSSSIMVFKCAYDETCRAQKCNAYQRNRLHKVVRSHREHRWYYPPNHHRALSTWSCFFLASCKHRVCKPSIG